MSAVLVVNAGSSSIKLVLLDGDEVVRSETVAPCDARDGLAGFLDDDDDVDEDVDAVGHRVVHGGTRFTGPTLLCDATLAGIEELHALAPLHQGPAVTAIRQARDAWPGVPQVACFDTAFHTTIPAAARTYPVPKAWRELGVRRYGFHGLAHAWAGRRAAELAGRPVGKLRTVTAHLGSGASLCAVDRGRSVDTTMGFTPTSGLVMGTRSGDLDPSVPPFLSSSGIPIREVASGLDRHSGLLALTGCADMRDVVAHADAGDDDAALAMDVWTHRARAQVAAMVAAMGWVDVLAFSGGVGEHQPTVRTRVVDGLGFLGLTLDPRRNSDARGDAVIGDGVVVVSAREDLVIAREVRRLLRGS